MNGAYLLANGRGIEELDARELCDVAYAMIVADIERTYYAQVSSGAKWEDTTDPLGDSVRRFEERIGLRDNPEDLALAMHKQLLAARGIEWDDTPVGSGSGQWWDQDVEFTDMSDLDASARKRKKEQR